ncbi:unnamed protein product [Euphydryas editha]|uniref:Uncharacterized protein n=1 Tax=Euphydryas editha TaxID=104508 RepID=A0AAU9UJ05_EUPED|nr:unnamed protein product [Euphydryas editha]
MGVLLKLFLVTVVVPCVFGQAQEECFGAGSIAGAAIGAFIAAFILIGAAYYFRKLYWKSRKGKMSVITLLLSIFCSKRSRHVRSEDEATDPRSINSNVEM